MATRPAPSRQATAVRPSGEARRLAPPGRTRRSTLIVQKSRLPAETGRWDGQPSCPSHRPVVHFRMSGPSRARPGRCPTSRSTGQAGQRHLVPRSRPTPCQRLVRPIAPTSDRAPRDGAAAGVTRADSRLTARRDPAGPSGTTTSQSEPYVVAPYGLGYGTRRYRCNWPLVSAPPAITECSTPL